MKHYLTKQKDPIMINLDMLLPIQTLVKDSVALVDLVAEMHSLASMIFLVRFLAVVADQLPVIQMRLDGVKIYNMSWT